MNLLRYVARRPVMSTRVRRWAVGLPLASSRPPAIFIHIPKSAGQSVTAGLDLERLTTLRRAANFFYPGYPVTFGHLSLVDLVRTKMVEQQYVEEAFVFTFVRDPYTRAVSLFRHLLETRRLEGVVSSGFREVAAAGSADSRIVVREFRRFLEHVAAGVPPVGLYDSFGLSQANPQVRWTESLRIDFIGSFEHLARDFRHLALRITGEEREPVQKNESKLLGHVGYDEFLQEECRALIEHIYREDFDAFGYSRGKASQESAAGSDT